MTTKLLKIQNLSFSKANNVTVTSISHLSIVISRSITTSQRLLRNPREKRRVRDLEIVTEKWKIFSRVLFLIEKLKREPEQVIPVQSLEQYRKRINLREPHKISVFLQKSPKLFELYEDPNGVLWCGFTKQAEELLEEEERIVEEGSEKAAEYVTRLLMMSVDKRIKLDKIAHFRREMGLPFDFTKNWVFKYPNLFRVVKDEDEVEFLELVSWNPCWAITELEKKVLRLSTLDESVKDHVPGWLSLPFPMKFPPLYKIKNVRRFHERIDKFQKRVYLSPYADASGLKAGTEDFDKRAIAVMHEILSFMNERRLVTDHLTHFRREFVMPQKLMRLLLKRFGIFYVSERGKRFSVFLTEAYEGSELIEKCPMVIWKEKVHSLIGYRGRKKKIETFDYLPDMKDRDLFESDSEEDSLSIAPVHEETLNVFDDISLSGNSEMEIEDVCRAYNDT